MSDSPEIIAPKKRGRKAKVVPVPQAKDIEIDSNTVNVNVTNEDFYALFQTNALGHQIFSHLYLKFLTGKQFDKDPYIHARNAGMAEVISYIVQRCRPTVETPAQKESPWDINP